MDVLACVDLKDRTDKELQSSVVYKFSCPGCQLSYIGKTDRCLRTRIKEHSSDKNSEVHKHVMSWAIFKTGNGESGNRGIRESGNRGIRESGNRGIGESGNRGIRESGNRGIGESSLLCILDCLCQSLKRGILPAVHTRLPLCQSLKRGIHPAVHTRLPMPIFKTGNPPCGAY